jgi:hypothetical protein
MTKTIGSLGARSLPVADQARTSAMIFHGTVMEKVRASRPRPSSSCPPGPALHATCSTSARDHHLDPGSVSVSYRMILMAIARR